MEYHYNVGVNQTFAGALKTVKTIHIHIGPHKTGSTAIQQALQKHKVLISEHLNLTIIDHGVVSRLSSAINNEDQKEISDRLRDLVDQCSKVENDCLFSSEDFAGQLPGRTKKRRPYPKLWQNLKLLAGAFLPNKCVFYFFIRDQEFWIKSAYVQHLKHRNFFLTQEHFEKFYKFENLWEDVLKQSSYKMGSGLVRIPYREADDFSAVNSLLELVRPRANLKALKLEDVRSNRSPSDAIIKTLECISRSSASGEAKRNAKYSIVNNLCSAPAFTSDTTFPDWNKGPERPKWLAKSLSQLWLRTEKRKYKQNQPNLLPDPMVDLIPYRNKMVSASDKFPEGGRGELSNQIKILNFRFRGFPETCVLLGLTISYLRRRTEHTEHAAFLFQRLWTEEYDILLATLQTRWLISAFQTFLDHGANEEQKVSGGSAYFYSNMLKAYEAERAIEGLPAGSIYPNTRSITPNGFEGLDRFKLGGSDLIVNMNALLLEIAAKEQISGRIIQEFVLRLKVAETLMSRMDHSRVAHKVDIPQFADCWSFYQEPSS